jgi:hypothetical protein
MSDDRTKYSASVMALLNKLPELYLINMPVIGAILSPDDPLAFDDVMIYNAKGQFDLYRMVEIVDENSIAAFSMIYYNEQRFEFNIIQVEFSYILTVGLSTQASGELHFLLAVGNAIPGLFLAMTKMYDFIQADILPGSKIEGDDNNNDNNDDGE